MNKYFVLNRLIEAVEKILLEENCCGKNDREENCNKNQYATTIEKNENMLLSEEQENKLFREFIKNLEVENDE